MHKKALASTLFLGAVCALPAIAEDETVIARFKGGIGVDAVSAGAGTANADGTLPNVTRNVVRGVNPAGQIWVIDKLEAKVRSNGHITVSGKGLILGGGNNAGRATGQSVIATFICDVPVTNPATPFVLSNTTAAGVPLSAEGNFRIDDVLSPVPPFNCPNPSLLIRNAANLGWFAVGNLRTSTGDDD